MLNGIRVYSKISNDLEYKRLRDDIRTLILNNLRLFHIMVNNKIINLLVFFIIIFDFATAI